MILRPLRKNSRGLSLRTVEYNWKRLNQLNETWNRALRPFTQMAKKGSKNFILKNKKIKYIWCRSLIFIECQNPQDPHHLHDLEDLQGHPEDSQEGVCCEGATKTKLRVGQGESLVVNKDRQTYWYQLPDCLRLLCIYFLLPSVAFSCLQDPESETCACCSSRSSSNVCFSVLFRAFLSLTFRPRRRNVLVKKLNFLLVLMTSALFLFNLTF